MMAYTDGRFIGGRASGETRRLLIPVGRNLSDSERSQDDLLPLRCDILGSYYWEWSGAELPVKKPFSCVLWGAQVFFKSFLFLPSFCFHSTYQPRQRKSKILLLGAFNKLTMLLSIDDVIKFQDLTKSSSVPCEEQVLRSWRKIRG